ncbi:restriction endonuclease subunit S [Aeromonas veronii]|uniref:restriction endonuclease subunit S n=1 Tax=Aeromonas TaxID=642 RepID=UPI00271466FD|nr:restriction endonuclease subunit S [Aeromonas veronii]WLD22125.1 restriction endonuclease subunit S [Aeromonas veronii]BED99200.1 restriction endonuclease subunit S [Aeromonas dhakensis]
MSEFDLVALGDIADIRMGQSPDSNSYTDDDRFMPFLQGCGDFTEEFPETSVFCSNPGKVAPEGSLLVSVRAPVGTTNIADQEYCIGRGLASVKSSILPAAYLREVFNLSTSFLYRRAQGSTFDAISSQDLRAFPIPVPKKKEKLERLVAIFDSGNSEIRATQALIKKNTLLKQGMMVDLFSRGIDLTTGLLRPSVQEAPELYYGTPLGFIPKGWVYGLLKSFVRTAEYGISTSLNDDVTGIPVLRMNNIQSNRFDVTDLKYTKDSDAYRLRLKKGDVLYNRTNSMEHVGKTAVWREELDECSFASYLVRLNLHEDLLKPEYFAHWMSQESSQNALRAFATPAVQQVNINPTNLQRVEICCPSDPHEQDLIVERIDALDENIAAESANLIKLQDQKAGLMRDLLTGKVPVSA